MSPIPDENQDNPSDYDPDKDCEELDTPDIIPPVDVSSTDEDDGNSDMEAEGGNDGYMLLPQEPDEDEEIGEGDRVLPPLPLSAEASILSDESMTEVRGAGVDMSDAVAQGNVHPAFMAKFPDNKVPVHLQIPDRPRDSKQEALWNQPRQETDRLQLDSIQVSKVKSAMVGFKLPSANIPEWAQQVPEEQWKQQLFARLGSTPPAPQVTTSASSDGVSPPQRSEKVIQSSEDGQGNH